MSSVRFFFVLVSVAFLLPAALVFAPIVGCLIDEKQFERKYRRVGHGMTVEDCRGVLGPETRTGKQGEARTELDGQLMDPVFGELILVWEKNGRTIWVGFDQGRVVSKFR